MNDQKLCPNLKRAIYLDVFSGNRQNQRVYPVQNHRHPSTSYEHVLYC
jgi:hypothetical protein